jgi:CheY-like chemotaxis protein
MMMTPTKIRRSLLTLFYAPLLIFLVLFEYFSWGDSALLLYFLCAVFLSLSLAVFSFWGIRSRLKPSTFFVVVWMLLGSLTYITYFHLYARWKFVYYNATYADFISCDIWSYRVLPELVLFIWLFSWVIGRLFGGVFMENGTRLRILLVEDDRAISHLMHHIIDSMKAFSVDRAYTYDEALEMFAPNKYIVVTLDLNLGHDIKQGVDLAEKFRNDDQDVYIAVVSGYFDEMFDKRLLDTVDDFIAKPFDISIFKLKMFLWAIKYKRRLMEKKENSRK